MDARRPAINISQGIVCGVEEKLPNRGSFYSFKGIPYAEPPIGPLRFGVCVVIFMTMRSSIKFSIFPTAAKTIGKIQRGSFGLQQGA